MVVFTCNHCGESVKKPGVEKHYTTKCRGAPKSISCMDCQKDFQNNYVEHVKCITELEKYSGKDYVHRESANSGAKKQEGWVEIVHAVRESNEYELSNETRMAFEMLQKYDNVPQKKAKFLNFVTNSVRIPRKTVEEVWSVLEKEQKKIKQAKREQLEAAKLEKQSKENKENCDEPKKKKQKLEQNGHMDGEEKQNKKKKKSDEESNENASVEETSSEAKLNMKLKKKQKIQASDNEENQNKKKKKSAEDSNENTSVEDISTQAKLSKKLKKKQKIQANDNEDDALTKTKQEKSGEVEPAANDDDDKVAKKKKKKQLQTDDAQENDLDGHISKKKKKKIIDYGQLQKETGQKKNSKSSVEDAEVQTQENGDISTIKKKKRRAADAEDESADVNTSVKKQKLNGETQNEVRTSKHLDDTLNDADAYSFSWDYEFTNVMGKYADGIEIEKLKKKLLKKYKTNFDAELSERQLHGFQKKFNKKLKKNNSFKVEGDIVKSIS